MPKTSKTSAEKSKDEAVVPDNEHVDVDELLDIIDEGASTDGAEAQNIEIPTIEKAREIMESALKKRGKPQKENGDSEPQYPEPYASNAENVPSETNAQGVPLNVRTPVTHDGVKEKALYPEHRELRPEPARDLDTETESTSSIDRKMAMLERDAKIKPAYPDHSDRRKGGNTPQGVLSFPELISQVATVLVENSYCREKQLTLVVAIPGKETHIVSKKDHRVYCKIRSRDTAHTVFVNQLLVEFRKKDSLYRYFR